jgi:hypothetical protein
MHPVKITRFFTVLLAFFILLYLNVNIYIEFYAYKMYKSNVSGKSQRECTGLWQKGVPNPYLLCYLLKFIKQTGIYRVDFYPQTLLIFVQHPKQ